MAESKILVFVICFLGFFFLLIPLMPIEFFPTSADIHKWEYPSFFSKDDIQNIQYFISHNVTKTLIGGEIEFDFNPDINVKTACRWYSATNHMQFFHIEWEFWFAKTYGYMFWVNQTTEYIDKDLVLKNWDSSINASVFYPVFCEFNHLDTKVWIRDNNHTRNDISTAWDSGTVEVSQGFGFDDFKTATSIWNIIGRLLTFQSPEIFGLSGIGATIINFVIAMPIWVCVAYCLLRVFVYLKPFS